MGKTGEIVIGVIRSCQMMIFKTSDDETKDSQSLFNARPFQKHGTELCHHSVAILLLLFRGKQGLVSETWVI